MHIIWEFRRYMALTVRILRGNGMGHIFCKLAICTQHAINTPQHVSCMSGCGCGVWLIPGLILSLRPANERRCYFVTNDVSHWLGASLEPALNTLRPERIGKYLCWWHFEMHFLERKKHKTGHFKYCGMFGSWIRVLLVEYTIAAWPGKK